MVTPELHRRGGTERGNAELLSRMVQHFDLHLFAHHWEPDGTPNVVFHRVPVIPWPGLARFLSFYVTATWKVRAAEKRLGPFAAVYSPGPNCAAVEVAAAHFCQARQLELYRSGRHRPPPASTMDWLKLWHRWSYAWCVARIEKAFYGLPNLRRVVAPSHLLARDLQHFYELPGSRLAVVHSGVNCDAFTPENRAALRQRARAETGVAPKEFVFLFAGNNWLIKGLYHVIRALPAVPAARLCIVGLGAERPESWQKLSLQLGVADRITYLPKRADIVHYYAVADALLAPSVYDTFAMMPLEAMACGLPVIISRNTGVAEIAGPADCLVVENVEDHHELAQAMQRMMRDAALRERLAANGLVLARQHRWDRIYQAIVGEMLAPPAQSRAA